GLDANGNPVNAGSGYYGQSGVPDVDYSDTETATATGDSHQYRPDGVGTAQNLYAGDTPRADHVAAGVPDYGLWRVMANEWLNYTRTFPTTHWNVYLRSSSQYRQDVRFDEITGDRAQPNQTKSLRGNFLVPSTGSSSRFRYVPLTDAVGNPVVLDFAGIKTFRMTALGGLVRANNDNLGSLQPTYFLFLPTADAAPQTPWLTYASPSGNAVDVDPQPTLQMIILNRTTSVSLGSIQLNFDNVNVTGLSTVTNGSTEGAGA